MTNTPFTLKDQKSFKTVFLNTVENCILRAVKLRGTRPKMHSKSALKKFTQNNQCNDEQKHIFTWTSAFGRPGFDTDWSVTDTPLQELPVQTSNKKINYFNEVKNACHSYCKWYIWIWQFYENLKHFAAKRESPLSVWVALRLSTRKFLGVRGILSLTDLYSF